MAQAYLPRGAGAGAAVGEEVEAAAAFAIERLQPRRANRQALHNARGVGILRLEDHASLGGEEAMYASRGVVLRVEPARRDLEFDQRDRPCAEQTRGAEQQLRLPALCARARRERDSRARYERDQRA